MSKEKQLKEVYDELMSEGAYEKANLDKNKIRFKQGFIDTHPAFPEFLFHNIENPVYL